MGLPRDVPLALNDLLQSPHFEPIGPLERKSFSTGQNFDTGYKQTLGDFTKRGGKVVRSLPIQPGDIIVNPTHWQEGHNIPKHLADKWVSSRVYRPTAQVPLAERPPVGEEDSDEYEAKVLVKPTAPKPDATALILEKILDRLEKMDSKPKRVQKRKTQKKTKKEPTADEELTASVE
jgi:hypothetical protein